MHESNNSPLVRKVLQFYKKISDDKNHRYKSWEHCYSYFQKGKFNPDQAALHLAFYLASWGMYRGSSGLLWKDYRIHLPAVEILKTPKYGAFNDFWEEELKEKYIERLLELTKELQNYYNGQSYSNEKKSNKKISATPTLITKIILGSVGASPALDSLFCKGFLKNQKKTISKLDTKSVNLLWDFARAKSIDIKEVQAKIQKENKSQVLYPVMKIVDMYFWKIGAAE